MGLSTRTGFFLLFKIKNPSEFSRGYCQLPVRWCYLGGFLFWLIWTLLPFNLHSGLFLPWYGMTTPLSGALQTLSGISIMTSMTSDPSIGGSDRRRVFVCSKNMFKYRSKHSFKGCAFDVWYKVGSFVRRSFSQWSL